MPDIADIRQPDIDWPAAAGAWGLRITPVTGLHQTLVSGALDAWSRHSRIPRTDPPGIDRDYAIGIARDRVLAVTRGPANTCVGWHAEGFAVTPIHDGLLVLDIVGLGLADLLCRAMTVPLPENGASAAVRFADLDGIAYRMPDEGMRLHVQAVFAAHLSLWLIEAARAAFGKGVQP